MTATLGVRLVKDITMSNGSIFTPKLSIGWLHQWADIEVDGYVHFSGSPVPFLVRSVREDRDALQLGLEADLFFKKNNRYTWGIKGYYSADICKTSWDQTLFLGAEIRF